MTGRAKRGVAAEEGLAEIEAIGGSIGSVLLGSSLERALIGLIVGMAIGWVVIAVRRFARRATVARTVQVRGHAV